MNHFKSTRQEDQKVSSLHTLPTSVQDTFEFHRDDEKEGPMLIISIISGLSIRINNLRKRRKKLVNI